jgi:hypothetical protein
MTARATWVWVDEAAPPDPEALRALAARERLAEAFVSVPWRGPTAATDAVVAVLRDTGVGRIAALGGDPAWVDGDRAARWARRAVAAGRFDGVHLDIEPWARPDWAGDEQRMLDGLERAARETAAAAALPVEVDLPPWLAQTHPRTFDRIVRRADAVTLMAYRDRAEDILAVSARARALLAGARRPWRIGVETAPVGEAAPAARETFADDGRAVLERELAAVVARLDPRDGFAGVAVHDAAGWERLAP